MTIRVFLVDDHEVVRRGVADLLTAEPDIDVVGEAATAREARARVAATRPDVAVLDVRLPDGSGIDLCRDLLSAHAGLRCLMLTAYDDDEANYAAVLAGASGYVLKDIRASGLVDGVRKVAAGRSLVGASVPARVVETLSRPTADPTSGLTLRERQVLELIAEGLTNREIGERLGLAEKTIKNYVSALFAKLGLVRRTQAAVFGATNKP